MAGTAPDARRNDMSSVVSDVAGAASLRIRPTAATAAEALDDPHYIPADPRNLLRADPTRRTPVHFRSAGLMLAGHLYRPLDVPAHVRTAAIVMCGPFSSVKEQTLPHYAERFQAAGYTVLTFDPRTFGGSEGEPRCCYDPGGIIADLGNAVSFLVTREDVEPARI